MIVFLLATNVAEGLLEFKRVPKVYKERVREQLKLMELEHLAVEKNK